MLVFLCSLRGGVECIYDESVHAVIHGMSPLENVAEHITMGSTECSAILRVHNGYLRFNSFGHFSCLIAPEIEDSASNS